MFSLDSLCLHSKVLKKLDPTRFRKSTTVTKHTGLNESDCSADSENEGASSDHPSDCNMDSRSKGMNKE